MLSSNLLPLLQRGARKTRRHRKDAPPVDAPELQVAVVVVNDGHDAMAFMV